MAEDQASPVPSMPPPILENVPPPVGGGQGGHPSPVPNPKAGNAKSHLTDDRLITKAHHSGRILFVLSALAAVGTVILGVVLAFITKAASRDVLVPMVWLTLVPLVLGTTGYGALAVSARRGNPNAVGAAIAILGMSMALGLISAAALAACSGMTFQPNILGLLLPALIMVGLFRNRNILLELQARGLWNKVFGAAKPSARLSIAGSILLATGVLFLHVSMFYWGWKADQARQAEARHVNAFVQLIQTEEKEYMTALEGLSANSGKTEIDAAMAKLMALEARVAAIERETAGPPALRSVLNRYGTAIQQWKDALLLLQLPGSDIDTVNKTLMLGNRTRTDACRQFDALYAPP